MRIAPKNMPIGLSRIKTIAGAMLALAAVGLQAQTSAAEAHMERGEYRKALDAIDVELRRNPAGNAELYLMSAIARLNLDDKTGALDAAERGAARFPKSERLTRYYAELLPDVLPSREVEARLESALARDPESGILKKALGKALLARKAEDPRTERLLGDAARAIPRDAEADFLYGKWACLHEKEQICVRELENSLVLAGPENYAAQVISNGMIAVAEERLGKTDAAGAAFARAFAAYLKLDPPVADVPYQYVKFLESHAEQTQARDVNEQILKRNPSFAAAHLEVANFLFREGNAGGAVEEGKSALRLSKEDKVQARAAHVFLARACAAAGDEDGAREHQTWVDANP